MTKKAQEKTAAPKLGKAELHQHAVDALSNGNVEAALRHVLALLALAHDIKPI